MVETAGAFIKPSQLPFSSECLGVGGGGGIGCVLAESQQLSIMKRILRYS